MSTPLWAESRFFSRCSVCQTPIRKGLRKCSAHKKRGKVTQGRPVTKGANARGIAAHKPDRSHTRRAKRQNPQVMGTKPYTRTTSIRADRAPATKRDRELW